MFHFGAGAGGPVVSRAVVPGVSTSPPAWGGEHENELMLSASAQCDTYMILLAWGFQDPVPDSFIGEIATCVCVPGCPEPSTHDLFPPLPASVWFLSSVNLASLAAIAAFQVSLFPFQCTLLCNIVNMPALSGGTLLGCVFSSHLSFLLERKRKEKLQLGLKSWLLLEPLTLLGL